MDSEAKEAAILDMLGIYLAGERIPRTQAEQHAADAQLNNLLGGMLAVVEDCSVQAVATAAQRFKYGLAGNPSFMPKPPEFSAEVRRLEDFLRPSADVPLQGIVEVDMGRGRIRTGHLTSAEVDYVLDRKGVLPDGRSMASLSPGDLKAEVAVAMKALPAPTMRSAADLVPHFKRMADA